MAPADHRGGKRRKLDNDGETERFETTSTRPSRFEAIPGGREWTVSIAIPGSIVGEHRMLEQRMTAPGRIARALAVFGVDEVVVYNDASPTSIQENSYADSRSGAAAPAPAAQSDSKKNSYGGNRRNGSNAGSTVDIDPCDFLAHLLSYLEAPPFMRKALFPLHPNLRLAGMLPSLDMPHHPNPIDAGLPYREGVTKEGMPKSGAGTLVDVGARQPVEVKDDIPPNTRVTLHMPRGDAGPAEAVHPAAPREDAGYYWGYSVRRAASLSAVFEECPHEGGYDVSVGTSERGSLARESFPKYGIKALDFKHLLIVFGGARGIEDAASHDPQLAEMGIRGGQTKQLFDHWINVLPNQGSRTILTDEAVFIALAEFQRLWDV